MIRKCLFGFILFPYLCWAQADSVERKTSFAAYPAFGYTLETNFIIGPVAVMTLKSRDESQDEYIRQSTFTPLALYTFRNQFLAELNLTYFFKNGNNLNIAPKYYSFPDYYFGLGNDNDPDVSESYTNRYFQVNGQMYFPLSTTTFIGTAFDLHFTSLTEIENGGQLEVDNPIGIDGGTLIGIGPAFKLDSRDNSIYPTKGNLLVASALIYEFGGFSFTSYLVDLRKYVTVRNDKNVLAFQFSSRMTSGDEVPFYKLPQLGGANQLRGIANASLYRDRQMFFSQLEYRRHIWWRFGLVAFAGFGDVSNQWSGFDTSTLKYVGGLGYRFQVLPKDKLNLRIDFGVSQNGQTGFYVGMQEAF
jgi:hypothetical protein